jgi:ABC-type tungstate transport system substrate-binding protein
VAAVLVLYPLHALDRPIVEPLVPVFQGVIEALDHRFVITDARLSAEGATEVVRFRANLREPVTVAGRLVYPFGSNGMPAGGYEVMYTLRGVLQYSALLLIIALAWPVRGARELAARLFASALFVGLLLLVDVPTTVIAELRHAVETAVDPGALGGWMIWSRFLMGGGGIALALLLAVLAISAGRRWSGLAPHEGRQGDSARPSLPSAES